MASFFSISQASNWRLHSTLTQHQLSSIYFLNYNTTIEKKNTINNIALLANNSYINNNKNNNEKQISSIAYAAKFECGVIFEDEGFLSPGYYDTDVSIFNKQGYPITVLLNVIVNDNINSSANSITKTIQPQKSTGISCKDITKLFNIRGQEMIEGFMTVLVQLDNGIAGSLSSSGAISITPSLQLSWGVKLTEIGLYILESIKGEKQSSRNVLPKELEEQRGQLSGFSSYPYLSR
jgi:hypothetical protein